MLNSVRSSVSLCVLSCLNCLTIDIDFGMAVDLDPGWAGIVGKGHKSKVRVEWK